MFLFWYFNQSQFYTCHSSLAVFACAKVWWDLVIFLCLWTTWFLKQILDYELIISRNVILCILTLSTLYSRNYALGLGACFCFVKLWYLKWNIFHIMKMCIILTWLLQWYILIYCIAVHNKYQLTSQLGQCAVVFQTLQPVVFEVHGSVHWHFLSCFVSISSIM